MKPAKISIIFFAISSLLLLSHASFVPDDIFPSSTADSKPYQPEDAERTVAVIRPEKSTEGSISAAIEPFHHVDLSLRCPIGHHIHRPIDPNFLRPFRHGCRGHRHAPRPPQLERDPLRRRHDTVPEGVSCQDTPDADEVTSDAEGISRRDAADPDKNAEVRARPLKGEAGDGARNEGGRGA